MPVPKTNNEPPVHHPIIPRPSTAADVQFFQRLGGGEAVEPVVELVHILGGLHHVDQF